MSHHGLKPAQIFSLLSGKTQGEIGSLEKWYEDVLPVCSGIYQKDKVRAFGDKSPDFFRDKRLVYWLLAERKLIYTVRDPRAILHSIENGPGEKYEIDPRWEAFRNNFKVWKPFLGAPSLLIVRYEDLISNPEEIMKKVYDHVGVNYSQSYQEGFPRLFGSRFLWKSAIDWSSGIPKQFDEAKIDRWRSNISDASLRRLRNDPLVCEFMNIFGYE